jgi:AraC-like DNA-binding protein
VIVLSPQFTKSVISEIQEINILAIGDSRLKPVIEINETEMQYLLGIIERIMKMQHNTSHTFQNYILRNEVNNLVFEILNIRIEKNKNWQPLDKPGHKEDVVREFIRLILSNYKEHHEVSFYANKLCMTANNLSRITKAYNGKRTINWITDVLITEAKILLRKPNNTVQQVSDELNFGDQSSFGKFFKKHTGLTPREYRTSVQK